MGVSLKQTPDAELSFARDLPLTQEAIRFAAQRHGSQRRDADGAEFIAHPVEVAALLRRLGYEDDVVAAAILHDVLEDTDAERHDLEARFGPRVSDIVAQVSDDPGIGDQEERREELRDRASHGYSVAGMSFPFAPSLCGESSVDTANVVFTSRRPSGDAYRPRRR